MTKRKTTKGDKDMKSTYKDAATRIMELAGVGYPEPDRHGNTTSGFDDLLDDLFEGSFHVDRKDVVGNLWVDLDTEGTHVMGTLLPRDVRGLSAEVSTEALRNDVLRRRWADDTAARVREGAKTSLDTIWWLCEDAANTFGPSPAVNWLRGHIEELKKAFEYLGPYDPKEKNTTCGKDDSPEIADTLARANPPVDNRKASGGHWTLEVTELKTLLPDGGLDFEQAEVFWDMLADIGMLLDLDTTTIVTRDVLMEGLEHKAPYFGEYEKVEQDIVLPLIAKLRAVPTHHFIALNSIDKTED